MLQCPQENPSSTTVLASICMSSQPPSLINCEATKCHELLGSISPWQRADHCTQAQIERERLIMGNWLMGLWRLRSSLIVCKLETQESSEAGEKGTDSSFLHLLLYSGPQWVGRCPPTLWRAIHLTKSNHSNANLIQKHLHRHIQIYCLIWAPTAQSRWHQINHHTPSIWCLIFSTYWNLKSTTSASLGAQVYDLFARKTSRIDDLFVEKDRIKEDKSKQGDQSVGCRWESVSLSTNTKPAACK